MAFSLYSFTDISSYTLPEELFFGTLKSTTKFKKDEILGQGSSSTVYAARDIEKNEKVAMKMLHERGATKISKGVFREITILKSLDHEHVIRLKEIVIDSSVDSLCLILDYCSYSLNQYIDSYVTPIPHPQVKCITMQMMKGLDYIHKNYIIHRDIKTTNLMMTPSNMLKIVDFGLSRRFTHQDKATTPGAMTRWYQAPEILFESPTYGPEVDIWSAACVIMELFQKAPFLPGESDIQQINLVIDLFGTPKATIWPDFVKCKVPSRLRFKNQPYNRLGERCQELGCTDAMSLLQKMFAYNPSDRLTAEMCLDQDWFEQAPFPSKSIEPPSIKRN